MELKNKTVELHITSRCTNDCVFCSVKKHPFVDPDKSILKKNIRIAKGCDRISFSGGEPTLRSDLIELIKYAKRIHSEILVETNGVNLNERCVKQLVNAGVTELKISVHGDTTKICEEITHNKKNFQNICKILDILKNFSNNIKITTNTVITKYNINKLVDLVRWLDKKYYFLDKIQISYPRFYKFSNCKKYLLPLSSLKKVLNKIILYSDKLILENIPLCIVNTKFAKNYPWNTVLAFNGKIIRGLDKRIYLSKCKRCVYKKNCQGIHNFYTLYFNTNFIKPFN